MLVRLMYASRAVAPEQADPYLLLNAILKTARSHNVANGVTGLLCYADGNFLQVLEGGRGTVNALYARILADTRHREVTLLSYQEVSERRYAGWTMGQVNLHRLNPGLVLKFSETGRLDPYAMSGAAVAQLFDEMCAAGAVAVS